MLLSLLHAGARIPLWRTQRTHTALRAGGSDLWMCERPPFKRGRAHTQSPRHIDDSDQRCGRHVRAQGEARRSSGPVSDDGQGQRAMDTALLGYYGVNQPPLEEYRSFALSILSQIAAQECSPRTLRRQAGYPAAGRVTALIAG